MIKEHRVTHMSGLFRFAAITVVLASLAACGSMRETLSGENSIDYKSSTRVDPLSVPPDLTQAAADPRYRAPASGSTTLTQYESLKSGTDVSAGSSGLTKVAVLPSYPGMQIKRDGDLRWLVIDQSPDVLFPKIEEFWYQNGFSLDVIDPKAGLMITNWAENRAKIPENALRELLKSVLDTVWDSGERDKFRTILERVGDGKTEVFISHDHMVQRDVGENYQTDTIKWEYGREDPGLNAAMLARLMVYLGESVEKARQKMAQADAQSLKPSVDNKLATDGTIVIDQPFEMAWRRVGLALDAGNFAVDDRNRSAGDFYVRYVDTDTGRKREEPGFFSRLFGSDKPPPATQFRLHLQSEGSRTVVSVYNDKGEKLNNETSVRILSVLAERL